MPITLNARVPYINADLTHQSANTRSYQWVVDTGAPDYIYLNSQLTDGMQFPKRFIETQTKNFEGVQIVRSAYLDTFTLADFDFPNIASHDLPKFKDDYGIGLIGSGLLRNFDVIFDYKNKRMALKANTKFSSKTYVNRSGINLEPHTIGAVVKSISKNSYAQRLDLKVGDTVSHINKQLVTPQNFDQLRAKLSTQKQSINICWTSLDSTKTNPSKQATQRCADVKLLALD